MCVRGDVLLDLCTGTAPRAGDLHMSLLGTAGSDRTRCVALEPLEDSLSTRQPLRAAELSTILLRLALLGGRSARLWMTSETVSGLGLVLFAEPLKFLPAGITIDGQ